MGACHKYAGDGSRVIWSRSCRQLWVICYACWEQNLYLLELQQEHLATEPPLQAPLTGTLMCISPTHKDNRCLFWDCWLFVCVSFKGNFQVFSNFYLNFLFTTDYLNSKHLNISLFSFFCCFPVQLRCIHIPPGNPSAF